MTPSASTWTVADGFLRGLVAGVAAPAAGVAGPGVAGPGVAGPGVARVAGVAGPGVAWVAGVVNVDRDAAPLAAGVVGAELTLAGVSAGVSSWSSSSWSSASCSPCFALCRRRCFFFDDDDDVDGGASVCGVGVLVRTGVAGAVALVGSAAPLGRCAGAAGDASGESVASDGDGDDDDGDAAACFFLCVIARGMRRNGAQSTQRATLVRMVVV